LHLKNKEWSFNVLADEVEQGNLIENQLDCRIGPLPAMTGRKEFSKVRGALPKNKRIEKLVFFTGGEADGDHPLESGK
jgi:hypothetical protein